MRCTNKLRKTAAKTWQSRRALALGLLMSCCVCMTGCGRTLDMRFSDNQGYSNFNFLIGESGSAEVADSFAQNLCVITSGADTDMITAELPDMTDSTAAALFDLNNCETLYAKNVFTKVYPASLTKVMTALVALEHASPEAVLTASSNVYMADSDAQVAGLAPGDTMTLDQALRILLLYSANDVAVMIAENIGGSVENFISMMNAEAKRLGATNTNFINSNGLSDTNHYTSAYDMYLVFNEALQYTTFQEIISMPTYTTVYRDRDGQSKDITVASTNMYLQNVEFPPKGVTVIGGKTGTTLAAGHCLVLLVKDTSGRPYIAIVMRAPNVDQMYDIMNELLELIPSSQEQMQQSDQLEQATQSQQTPQTQQ